MIAHATKKWERAPGSRAATATSSPARLETVSTRVPRLARCGVRRPRATPGPTAPRPRFPGLRAHSARIPSRGESRRLASCPRGWPCSTVRAAPPLTRTRSQSAAKQQPAECRRALLQLVRSASPALGLVGRRDAQVAGVSFRAQHTWAVRPERRWVSDSASPALSHPANASCG